MDDDYVGQTGEGVVGRKVRVRPPFVEEAFVAVEALADRLQTTALRDDANPSD